MTFRSEAEVKATEAEKNPNVEVSGDILLSHSLQTEPFFPLESIDRSHIVFKISFKWHI